MPLTTRIVRPGAALAALAEVIADVKGPDPLAAVVVAVPTNACGVMARRALGRAGGAAGVDMVTLNRLAELIAGPELAAAGRSPVSTPVLELTVAGVLERQPGTYRPVASHPTTVVALRKLHEELRLAGPEAAAALAEHSSRGREAARVSQAVAAALSADWYDEADLVTRATDAVRTGRSGALRPVVVYLPETLTGLARGFVEALAERTEVRVVVAHAGEAVSASAAMAADELPPATADQLPEPRRIISTTDADDEVRHAVRAIVDAARSGMPLERIAVLWPSERPYARLVEHHLEAAGIRWNGRGGTTTIERLAPRLVLDLLDVDRRGLRRRSVFELLADVPARGADGAHLPTAEWERASREAGVARDDDWDRRLAQLAGRERWATSATSLRAWVGELRGHLGHPAATRPWADWSAWCEEQLQRWLGRATIDHLPDPEYRAYEALLRALDRLGHLDAIGQPVTRHRFRSMLEAELDATPGRQGRVGDGVTVGPLAGAVGLDVDLTIVLGAAEGVLPPAPVADPLLSDADRASAGLATADGRVGRLHRQLLAALDVSDVVVTIPRGDLRATTRQLPSRWLSTWLGDGHDIERVPSHHAGLAATEFPATPAEHRLRGRLVHVRSGASVATAPGVDGDAVFRRGLACVVARRSSELTVYDGDLSSVAVPHLGDPVSPSRLEAWVACPHAYFLRYLLHIRPVDEPDAEISITALDKGSAHHDALDRFHRAVIDGTLPQPTEGWTDEHRRALLSYFDEVCAITERRGRTGRPAYWADERERMRAELVDWLDHDSHLVRRRGATVLASEHRFGDGTVTLTLPGGRALALEGSVDRIDLTGDGVLVVTDHKTGSNRYTRLSPDDPTLAGTIFQLPSYAAAARAGFGSSDSVVHAEYSLLRKGDFKRPGVTIDERVSALVAEQLAVIVDGIESGFYPNVPERPGWRMWVSCEYCEPDHLGTADLWADWQRKRYDPRLKRWFGDVEPDVGEGSP